MNKILNLFVSLFLGFSLITSCSPDEITPESADVTPEDLVEGIAFKIEHDAANQNIVYLKSLMGSQYTPLWTHPQGRSQEPTVELKMAFAGTYEVRFGVQTRGGAVFGPPATFTIDEMYAEFISDPLWTLLAGGAGEEKTWYLDLDADAVSRYFVGPLYFYGVDDSWLTVTDGQTVDGDSWNWCPDYPGNSWLFAAVDFGSMTFDLKDGANVRVEHLSIPARGIETGTYMIDVENHTLKMVDASPLHDVNRDGVVIDWGDIKIMSLTEDAMQLGVLRDAVLSGEGACLLVYNFISKNYKDNWTPGETTEPDIVLPDGWQDDISQIVTSSIKWVLSPTTPFNWANSAGELLNGWSAAADYPEWAGFVAADADAYADFSLTLNSDDHSAVYVAPDGREQTGSYELSENGYYTFTGFTPSVSIGSWMVLRTTDDNQWRVVRIEKGTTGIVTGMWVGIPNPDNSSEYIVWKLEAQTGGGSSDADATVRTMLCAHTWKIDVAGTKFGGPLTYAPLASFPSLADNYWTPDLPTNSWVMIDGDHGSMKFNEDGTVSVVQKTVADGAFAGEETRAGIWHYDGATLKLLVSIPILHADNFTGNVVNWGDSRIASVGDDFLRLVVVRDPVLSGEDEYLYVFNYIPAD
jgi:hypothetical protein